MGFQRRRWLVLQLLRHLTPAKIKVMIAQVLKVTSIHKFNSAMQDPSTGSYGERNLISFKLLYQKQDSNVSEIQTIKDVAWEIYAKNVAIINGSLVFFWQVTGLEKFTKYEFKVCVFSSVECGPESSSKIARTLEDGKGL